MMLSNGAGYMMGNAAGWYSLLGIITWLALLAFLISGSYYFWQQAKRNKK